MAANNVMAHVPELNQFVAGFAVLLKPEGVLTVEFPHLLNLIEQVQFDTIYHEHYSYLSLLAAEKIFAAHGLRVFDVEELPTHGGSLRLYVCHRAAGHADALGLARVRKKEVAAGLDRLAAYDDFAPRVAAVRDELRGFLAAAQADGKSSRLWRGGQGQYAAELLRHHGAGDRRGLRQNPHKQNHLLPGSQIPIRAPEAIVEDRPDYLLILPWNLKAEVAAEQAQIRGWNGHFVIAIPQLQIF